MNSVVLFEEYRFIEKNPMEISSVWKGAHLLLFFLAFIFGSFCTFCFHMLMYLFDEKCVLFPKLLSLSSIQHNVLYEFIPVDKEVSETLPVDFVSTQWADKSVCYLPTFVPLVSGICGLIWTTMFLMFSTGSQKSTGLKSPWRILPPVFVFSLAMTGLCIYVSCVTHSGLEALCLKLGELTNSSSCSYTINVATLVYERRIRGVYQAIRLTILSAWLHTMCWTLSAILALARMLLAVDFQLVQITAQLEGDIDKMLEKHERHIKTISPESWTGDRDNVDGTKYIHKTDNANENNRINETYVTQLSSGKGSNDTIFVSKTHQTTSEMALVPSESTKLAKLSAFQSLPKENQFIVSLLYDLIESFDISGSLPEPDVFEDIESIAALDRMGSAEIKRFRQLGQGMIDIGTANITDTQLNAESENANSQTETTDNQLFEIPITSRDIFSDSISYFGNIYDSTTSFSQEIRYILGFHLNIKLNKSDRRRMRLKKKSNLKSVGSQTDKSKSRHERKVNIAESRSSDSIVIIESLADQQKANEPSDKKTQALPKEKQD